MELFSREVANILKVFDLSCHRAYPHLDKRHIFFLSIAVTRASSLSVQWLRRNEPSGADYSVFLEEERLPHTAGTAGLPSETL